MGLHTTHDCWSGSYSSFYRWRTKIAEVAGYGKIYTYPWYEDQTISAQAENDWKEGEPLMKLLWHSDCDGEIQHEDCGPIADALEKLLPSLARAGDGGGHVGLYVNATNRFIDGLRLALKAEENVKFY